MASDELAPNVRADVDDALRTAGVPGPPDGSVTPFGEYTVVPPSVTCVPGQPIHLHLTVTGASSLVNLTAGNSWRSLFLVHRFNRPPDGPAVLIAIHAVAMGESGPVEVFEVWKAPA